MKKLLRRAASVVILGAAAFATGCSGSGAREPAPVSGSWVGSLSFTFLTGDSSAGRFEMSLVQDGEFASGIAEWTPLGVPQSATAAIDGDEVTLFLAFWCDSNKGGVTLTGTVAGDVLTFTDAVGIACLERDVERRVAAGEAVLERDPSAEPL